MLVGWGYISKLFNLEHLRCDDDDDADGVLGIDFGRTQYHHFVHYGDGLRFDYHKSLSDSSVADWRIAEVN